jgi:hypothetical protein
MRGGYPVERLVRMRMRWRREMDRFGCFYLGSLSLLALGRLGLCSEYREKLVWGFGVAAVFTGIEHSVLNIRI